ncbi:glycosyl transferase [Marichromatium sp. AB31]|uniref:glycosyl transferase n=1 Tax=Marichromatium sp. AB31 TaxID=2483362 RepID=UPI000F40C1C7|nr:glycosyl transferase [Marichromatium sp. AB31]RNE92206.1 glycosyl transferase [Marichromatium sp. AB31]
MKSSPHCFTSITSNYLPKARVLASSIKRVCPDAGFHLMLSDTPPSGFDLAAEPFDSVLQIEDLPVADVNAWVFKHSVVELCTAVKGLAAQEIARRHDAAQVFYFDPDMVVFGGLDELSGKLAGHSVALTPHLTAPEEDLQGILDNEISALKHGIYNLGFVGVNTASSEGRRFLDWWAARLVDFCYDDIPNGLFTDQRWVDLAPGFFEDVLILRDPQYNVATWNISHRQATGSIENGIEINGQPLSFYHFSGFDSGAQEAMLKRYGKSSPVLFKLRDWYIEECRKNGQDALGKLPCKFACYSNGETITKLQRIVYRNRQDLQDAFPDPFDTSDLHQSYYDWFRVNGPAPTDFDELPAEALRAQLSEALDELRRIKHSRSWKLARLVSRGARLLRR